MGPSTIEYEFVANRSLLSSAREYIEVVAPEMMTYTVDSNTVMILDAYVEIDNGGFSGYLLIIMYFVIGAVVLLIIFYSFNTIKNKTNTIKKLNL